MTEPLTSVPLPKRSLEEREAWAIARRAEGWTLARCARELCCTRERVQQMIEAVRRRERRREG